MKTRSSLGGVLLLAAALGLQAQTAPGSSSQTDDQPRKDQPKASSSSNQPATPVYSPSSTDPSQASANPQQSPDQDGAKQNRPDQASAPSAQSSDQRAASNQPAKSDDKQNQNNNSSATASTSQTATQSGSRTDVAVSGQVDTQVRTVVQQIDAQGPVVVDRISTHFADVTCNEDNARALVTAMHDGTSVTLRGDNGQTATFAISAHLGYGDAYVAMSLAVEALRAAGISGCATPAQWQAVLVGGELRGATVTAGTERFPGILVLHEQGGWTQVAQTTHVELQQVVSQADASLQINTSNSRDQGPTPTGHSSDYNPRNDQTRADQSGKMDQSHKMNHDDKANANKDQDHDAKSPDRETPPKSEPPPKS